MSEYLKGWSKQHRRRALSLISSERTGGNGHKLKCKTFQLNIIKDSFHSEGDQALEEVAKKSCRVFILKGIKI